MKINVFIIIFPLFFAGIWVVMTYIFSRFGWSDLSKRYRYKEIYNGERIGLISAGINGLSYNNCIIMKFDSRGIFLRPIFLFRLFHPAVLIPWTEIMETQEKKILFFKLRRLIIGNPFAATLTIKEKVFKKIENNIIDFQKPYR